MPVCCLNGSVKDRTPYHDPLAWPLMIGFLLRKGSTVSPEWKINFRYADTPRDCEAVSVDTENRRIFL